MTVTGPRETIVTFRKERVARHLGQCGPRTFVKAPSYLTVLANRTINDIADVNTLRRTADRARPHPAAAGDLRRHRGLDPRRSVPPGLPAAQDRPEALSASSRTASRSSRRRCSAPRSRSPTMRRPAPTTSTSSCSSTARCWRARRPRSRSSRSDSSSSSRNAARDHGLLYGLATAMMALLTGWFASVVFRKD